MILQLAHHVTIHHCGHVFLLLQLPLQLPFPSAAAGIEVLVLLSALFHSTHILSKTCFLSCMRVSAAKYQHSLQRAAILQRQAAKRNTLRRSVSVNLQQQDFGDRYHCAHPLPCISDCCQIWVMCFAVG